MLADALSAALLCPNAHSHGGACGRCDACRRLERQMHPDLDHYSLQRQRDDQSSKTRSTTLTVDTIRSISASASLKPFAGTHRVIVVDDAEAMQPEAQEAFLKTLEEPPAYLVLMLLADSSDSLKPTILSRCEQIELRPVSYASMVDHLVEGGLRGTDASALAALALGSLEWAFDAADDAAQRSRREAELAVARAWIASPAFGRIARALSLGADFSGDRETVYESLTLVGHIWRSVLHQQSGLRTSADHAIIGDLKIDRVQPSTALRALESVTICQRDLERNIRPRLALEAMVTTWPTLDQ